MSMGCLTKTIAITALIIMLFTGASVLAADGGAVYEDPYQTDAADTANITAAATLVSAGTVTPGAPIFSGELEKKVTYGTTQAIAFAASDFTGFYTPSDGSMTAISISRSGGSTGYFTLKDADYHADALIPVADISSLRFIIIDTGEMTFTVSAHNASTSGIGGVTLRITVASDERMPELDEITYDVSKNGYKYLDERDFNSVFNDLTKRKLSYVRFTQPSSTYGKLYYNYSSSSSYDYTVSSDEKYYREYTSGSVRFISNVAIVPRDNYEGTFYISYKAYDEDNRTYNGTLRVRVDDSGSGGVDYSYALSNSVSYSTDIGVPITFSSSDFSSSFSAATGLTLSYIRFTSLPAGEAGRLRTNYVVASGTSSGSVTAETRYYVSGYPEIGQITFIPASDYKGYVSIPYTSYAINGAAYGGTLYIRIGQTQAGTLADLNYTIAWTSTLTLPVDDIQKLLTKSSNMSMSYIMITELPSGGALYYNYKSTGSYDSAVSKTTRYYRSSNPLASLISFVPGKSQPAKVTVRYTAYVANGAAYNGKITISPQSAGKLKTLTYMSVYGELFDFGDAGAGGDIKALVGKAGKKASRETLSYITFKLPPPSDGTLYTAYSGAPSKRKAAAEGEKIYYSGSPSIGNLSFYAETDGTVRLDYTAYAASGVSFEGKIALKQLTLPDGWSHEETKSLAKRGVVPDKLLSDYGSPITRAEFAALLVKAYNYLETAGSGSGAQNGSKRDAPNFSDLSGNPYARFVTRGYALSIIDGVSETRFDPDSPITREAAAKILCAVVSRITGETVGPGGELTYADRSGVSEWAAPYVAYARAQGLMAGDGNDMFRPQDSLSREEAMALVERAITKII